MSEAVTAALITGALALVGTLAGSYFSNRKTTALLEYRMDALEGKMDKHNNVIERTYKLEEQTAVLEEKMSVANHRIEDLEKRA